MNVAKINQAVQINENEINSNSRSDSEENVSNNNSKNGSIANLQNVGHNNSKDVKDDNYKVRFKKSPFDLTRVNFSLSAASQNKSSTMLLCENYRIMLFRIIY